MLVLLPSQSLWVALVNRDHDRLWHTSAGVLPGIFGVSLAYPMFLSDSGWQKVANTGVELHENAFVARLCGCGATPG